MLYLPRLDFLPTTLSQPVVTYTSTRDVQVFVYAGESWFKALLYLKRSPARSERAFVLQKIVDRIKKVKMLPQNDGFGPLKRSISVSPIATTPLPVMLRSPFAVTQSILSTDPSLTTSQPPFVPLAYH